MIKSEILKKILAMGLILTSMVPVVGASVKGLTSGLLKRSHKDEGNSSVYIPPLKRNHGVLGEPTHGPEDRDLIRESVYSLYNHECVRNTVFTEGELGSERIRALKYLFLIIDGKVAYNYNDVERAYNVLDPDQRTEENIDLLSQDVLTMCINRLKKGINF